MDYIITRDDGSEVLYHHGIKGMHWGIRRYQNKDGSYTEAGKKRYLQDKTKAISRDIANFEKYATTGIKNRRGKVLVSKKDTADIINALKAQKNQQVETYSKKWKKKVNKDVAKRLVENSKKEIKDRSKEYKELKKMSKKNKNLRNLDSYKSLKKEHGRDMINKIFGGSDYSAFINMTNYPDKYKTMAKELGFIDEYFFS